MSLNPGPSTPLPKLQITIAALLQAGEGFAGTVIFPFVPKFVQDTGITGGDERKTGYWAGVLESLFFITKFLSVYIWARAADRFGRRPIILIGPLGLAVSLFGFGCSKTFWGLLFWRGAQGIFNGNLGVVQTVLVELSDKSNLAQVMSFTPVAWSSSSTFGPVIGGLLSEPAKRFPESLGKLRILQENPYLLPCAVVGLSSLLTFLFALFALKETSPAILASQNKRTDEAGPLLGDDTAAETNVYGSISPTSKAEDAAPDVWELLTPKLTIPLVNSAILSLVHTSYQVLFPLVYATSIANGGLGFSPYDIGMTRGISGVISTVFALVVPARIIKRYGARTSYITAFSQFLICLGAFPILSLLATRAGRVDALVWCVITIQLTAGLWVGTTFASLQIFIVRSVPRPSALSKTNSLSQMVATITRAMAPFMASSLFAVSVQNNWLGGYLVYALLLVLVCVGIFMSFSLEKEP
ncbi:unnamed protein product [Mycena citricolor]|uniref:Major facilitator superfamily (MFS) profile domain-containing protein n=1 Tax=Mycena citricolor TaxID=2018698 RepID=A0AAD2HMY3_9AGAR|nr:unnamed protein product [Mycena citricolor]CAK5278916.1 unnamed protein product [Mycena citricolor]